MRVLHKTSLLSDTYVGCRRVRTYLIGSELGRLPIVSAITETVQQSIRQNIFPAAHWAIPDWSAFRWHRTNGVPDSHVPHSSQAFCISVWGTFASTVGKAVRHAVVGLLQDPVFEEAVEGYDAELPFVLESDSRKLLNEFGGTQSHLDGALRLETLIAVIESKLREPLGACSQAKNGHCSGIYGPGSDLKLKKQDPCRLEYHDRNRTPRLYWDIMKPISRDGVYRFGQACPFAGSGYQVMRNIAAAVRMTTETKTSQWRAIFAYPADAATQEAIRLVRDKLREEHQRRVLTLDYIALAKALNCSADVTARGLARHMAVRLGINLSSVV